MEDEFFDESVSIYKVDYGERGQVTCLWVSFSVQQSTCGKFTELIYVDCEGSNLSKPGISCIILVFCCIMQLAACESTIENPWCC